MHLPIFLSLIGCLLVPTSMAQDSLSYSDSTLLSDSVFASTDTSTTTTDEVMLLEPAEEPENPHVIIQQQFVNGDWRFMTPVLLCLIIGLAISVERIVILNLATSNVDQTLRRLNDDLRSGGVDQAVSTLQLKRSPVARIFRQSLTKWKEGIAMMEKAVIAYGSVEMGKLERGLVWISLFIAIAPMLGFMGTVIGMINAFDAIEAAGDISPTLVASGIKTALLTTVAGLIVAIILQLFYNYCVAKIDLLVNDMERASIAFIDIIVDHSRTIPSSSES